MKLIALDHYDMVRRGELELSKLASFAARYGAKPLSEKELSRLDDSDFGLIVVASDGSRSRNFPLRNQFEVIFSKSAAIANAEVLPEKALNVLNSRLTAAGRRYLPGAFYKTAEASKAPSPIYLLTGADEIKLAAVEKMEKTAGAGHFAITESINGDAMNKFPIDTDEQIRRRINRFGIAKESMHIKYAFQYAKNVSERADEKGIKIPEDSTINLFKTAAHNRMTNVHINDRIKMAPDPAQSEYLGLMLKTASATPEQVAVSLDSIDRKYGMDQHYGVHYPSASDSSLSMEKRAETFTVGDSEVDRQDVLSMLSSNEPELTEELGEETVKAMKDDPESVLSSLPAPYRQKILERLNNTSS